jgi:putative ABC transport system permease protein
MILMLLLSLYVGVIGAKLVSVLAGWPTLWSPQVILLAVAFSSAVGIFFGFYPARRAAHLAPIQALQYESVRRLPKRPQRLTPFQDVPIRP